MRGWQRRLRQLLLSVICGLTVCDGQTALLPLRSVASPGRPECILTLSHLPFRPKTTALLHRCISPADNGQAQDHRTSPRSWLAQQAHQETRRDEDCRLHGPQWSAHKALPSGSHGPDRSPGYRGCAAQVAEHQAASRRSQGHRARPARALPPGVAEVQLPPLQQNVRPPLDLPSAFHVGSFQFPPTLGSSLSNHLDEGEHLAAAPPTIELLDDTQSCALRSPLRQHRGHLGVSCTRSPGRGRRYSSGRARLRAGSKSQSMRAVAGVRSGLLARSLFPVCSLDDHDHAIFVSPARKWRQCQGVTPASSRSIATSATSLSAARVTVRDRALRY